MRLPILSVALSVFLLLRQPTAAQELFGNDEEVVATINNNAGQRALTCPASNCDGTGILEHHLDNGDIGTSVACLAGANNAFTAENSYFRCFASSLCSTTRIVDSVSFRVQKLEGSSITVFVRIYKGGTTGCASAATTTALVQQTPSATATVSVTPGEDFLVVAPIPGSLTLFPSESLLVEVNAPNMNNVGQFFIGDSMDVGQCDASYIRCNGSGNLQSTAGIGFNSVSYIITANTRPAPTTPTPPTGPTTPTTPTGPTPTPPTGPIPVPQFPTFPPITNAPVIPREPTCFDDFGAALMCVVQYLFGWLLPF